MAFEAKWSDLGNLDAERAVAAINSHLPRWVSLALVVAIAWQLAEAIWMLMPGGNAGNQVIAPPVQVSRSASGAGSTVDVQQIANAHLFGEADAEPVIIETIELRTIIDETSTSRSKSLE